MFILATKTDICRCINILLIKSQTTGKDAYQGDYKWRLGLTRSVLLVRKGLLQRTLKNYKPFPTKIISKGVKFRTKSTHFEKKIQSAFLTHFENLFSMCVKSVHQHYFRCKLITHFEKKISK